MISTGLVTLMYEEFDVVCPPEHYKRVPVFKTLKTQTNPH